MRVVEQFVGRALRIELKSGLLAAELADGIDVTPQPAVEGVDIDKALAVPPARVRVALKEGVDQLVVDVI